MKLDHLKMLEEIDNFVENDLMSDMMERTKPYTQKEARKMAQTLGSIYSISHCIHCEACQPKYKKKFNLFGLKLWTKKI